MDTKTPGFEYTPEQIKNLGDSTIREFEEKVKTILQIPEEKRNFKNTVYAFEQAINDFSDSTQIPIVLGYVSDNEQLRNASQELELKISRYSVDIFTREDIFNALKSVADLKETLDEIDKKLLEKTLLDFKKNGLGLAPGKKNKVKKLLKELVEMELKFSVNLRNVKDFLELSLEDLKGLGDDYIQKLKKSPQGKYIVTMDYPDYLPFMDNAENDSARKELEFKFNNRCSKENTELMEKAIILRRKIAKLIGYDSFANYVLDDRMAKNSENVFDFLNRILGRLKRKGRKELKDRISLKKQRTGQQDADLNAWEWRFYNNLLKKTKYRIDHEKIKEFFPLEKVVSGMFEIFTSVFGAKFVPADLPAWHKEVRSYQVQNPDGSLIGYFYLDLFPRDGKYKHAACFSIVRGRELPDGTYQKPAASIVANFPRPQNNLPSLLTFNEAGTLFHEFGHVLHHIFTTAKYGKFAGTCVSRDFVEVPSTMLQNWAYSREVLKTISGHYKTGEKLPDEIIKKLIDTKNMDSGLFYLRQLFFSILDMRYHTRKGGFDSTKLYEKLMNKISLVPMSEGTHPQASFGHLMGGYEAGYYSYLWSEVIAADLFSVFEKNGIMNHVVGKNFRETILAPGRSLDELEQVKKFLGRELQEDAFFKSIGAELKTKKFGAKDAPAPRGTGMAPQTPKN